MTSCTPRRRKQPRPGLGPVAAAVVVAVPLAAQQQGSGPTNPRLLPDISVVGDLGFDLSRRSTQEDGRRFTVREIEVAFQAAVDPYFRGDVFVGYSDLEGVSIEQAYLTATALPWQVEGRLGRFIMPFGKQNLTHRHDLHTIDYPYVLQRFLGEEGLKGTGLYASKVISPFGFYQEFIVSMVDHLQETEGLHAEEPSSAELSGLGYMARLRNYWDLTPNANLEVSASASTGRRAQPLDVPGEINAVNARQSLVGLDVTYRWRPLQQGLYKSLIVQGEYLRQFNEKDPTLPDGVEPWCRIPRRTAATCAPPRATTSSSPVSSRNSWWDTSGSGPRGSRRRGASWSRPHSRWGRTGPIRSEEQ